MNPLKPHALPFSNLPFSIRIFRVAMRILILIFFLGLVSWSSKSSKETLDPNLLIKELTHELAIESVTHFSKIENLQKELKNLKEGLKTSKKSSKKELKMLVEIGRLNLALEEIETDHDFNVSKIRYVKGIEIIKALYEKVLSLDHHFSSVRTFSEISKITNPNQYPEFGKLKEHLQDKKSKKAILPISDLLSQNIMASFTQIIINLSNSSLTEDQKREEIEQIECILDFTLRMHNDLNTIYFETTFLHSSNEGIKESIETLFSDYTAPISYFVELPECRAQDDWSSVWEKLNAFTTELETSVEMEKYKMMIDIEFSIDRLVQFINEYNRFIDEGKKFYEKFSVILNSYENEVHCSSSIPIEYNKLKDDINLAVEKFSIAYKPIELNGSKMKEVLYGINAYE